MDHDRISDIESYVDPSSFLYPTINLLTEKKYTFNKVEVGCKWKL